MRIASQKKNGNSTETNRPNDRNRCATTGGKRVTAIQAPYGRPRRREIGRIEEAAATHAAMFPVQVMTSIGLMAGSPGSLNGSGAPRRSSKGTPQAAWP